MFLDQNLQFVTYRLTKKIAEKSYLCLLMKLCVKLSLK